MARQRVVTQLTENELVSGGDDRHLHYWDVAARHHQGVLVPQYHPTANPNAAMSGERIDSKLVNLRNAGPKPERADAKAAGGTK